MAPAGAQCVPACGQVCVTGTSGVSPKPGCGAGGRGRPHGAEVGWRTGPRTRAGAALPGEFCGLVLPGLLAPLPDCPLGVAGGTGPVLRPASSWASCRGWGLGSPSGPEPACHCVLLGVRLVGGVPGRSVATQRPGVHVCREAPAACAAPDTGFCLQWGRGGQLPCGGTSGLAHRPQAPPRKQQGPGSSSRGVCMGGAWPASPCLPVGFCVTVPGTEGRTERWLWKNKVAGDIRTPLGWQTVEGGLPGGGGGSALLQERLSGHWRVCGKFQAGSRAGLCGQDERALASRGAGRPSASPLRRWRPGACVSACG